jgi:poly(A) polymerase
LTNPTIHSASEVGISHQAISKNAIKVVQDLQKAGYQAYLVGGCVRDLLLDMKPKDFDVATNATPEQIKKTCRNGRIIGRRFRLVHVRFGYEVIEVATFRANANDRDEVGSHQMREGDAGQLLRDNVFGSIEEDVRRRDFRVNALYYDPISDEILDFVGGMEDIQERRLCSIGEPQKRFREDPVRMLRVIRFAAKLGFSMEPGALQMIEDEGKLLANVSPARLFEEVLKLFHGGAAYDTYLLLRKYGLFKYLFPFTDSCVEDNVDGMPERALQNTDKRIHQGKPVIPAFLFASMLWDPVKADAQTLVADGSTDAQAWRIAMNDALRDQNQYVAVPRRLAEIILDIWNIHFRLIKRNPVMIKASLNNRRFRAAYDFLLLRSDLHEVEPEVAQWWTEIQTLDEEQRLEMVAELGKNYKSERQARDVGGEANGNSINYAEKKPAYTKSRSKPGPGRAGQGKRKQGQNTNRGGRSQPGRGNRSGNTANSGNSSGNSPGNNGYSNSGRQRQSQPQQRHSSDGGYVNARPKDEYGHHTPLDGSGDQNIKKVKVRHKRRVASPNDETDNNPHF